MSHDCIFCRIASGALPASVVYEDADFLSFKDINPAAPVHLLLIPRRHLARLSETRREDADLLGRFMATVAHIAREQRLESYRFIINDGAGAGQTVFHLHGHILAGRRLGEKLL